MAVQLEVFTDGSRLAGEDLSAAGSLNKLVKLDSAGAVVLCTGTTDKPFGVLMVGAASGKVVAVGRVGRYKIQGDADLAKGNMIGTSLDGQAAAYAYGTDTTKYIIGEVVIDNAAAAGLITADIQCINPPRGA